MMKLDAEGTEKRLRLYGYSPAQAYAIAQAVSEICRANRFGGDADNRLRNAVDRIAAKRRLETFEADAINRLVPVTIKRFCLVLSRMPVDFARDMDLGQIEIDGETLFSLVRSLTHSWDGMPYDAPFGSTIAMQEPPADV